MRKPLALLCLGLICSALLLTACGAGRKPASCRVIVASDLHYIAPTLTDHGALFMQLTDAADGKVMRYSEELTDAFLAEVIAACPEALILTGDLSFNGAVESHEALADKLAAVEEAGIPVLVLPGNHDVFSPSAARYHGDSAEWVPAADSADFRRIYAAFGFDEAIAADAVSLSYVYPLNETTRVLMLDADSAACFGGLSDETLAWVQRQLRQARRAGVSVLAAGHQNLFQQTMFREGYVMTGAEELLRLLRRYEVPLFLSGHLHVQHRMTREGVTEITTSALSVSPCQYALLSAQQGRIAYETRPVDVAAWARGQGSTDENLLSFASWAADYFDARTMRQIPESLADAGFSEDEIACMTDYLCRVNRAYFSGDLRDLEALDPDGAAQALWARAPGLYGIYLDSIRGDFGQDFCVWQMDVM